MSLKATFLLSIIAFVSFCLLPGSIGGARPKPIRRVLIIYEVGTDYPGVNLIDEGIRAALDNSPYKVEFYREYMDATLFPDPADQQRFREFYIRKYQNRRPDVIITAGPSPLKFMTETHVRAFPGVPVVFCYPNWAPGSPTPDSDFTGVENELAVSETIETALHLQPDTRHVFAVGGTSFNDTTYEDMVKEKLRPYEGKLDVSYLTNLTMPDLVEQLKHLPNHAIVLLMSFSRDAAGTKFVSGGEASAMVAAASNAPVFSMADSQFGHGEVGGKVTSFRQQGLIAGSLALRILKGKKARDVPRLQAGTTYMFDWRALKRWGLRGTDLPPGSLVLYQQPSFWELYWRYVIVGVFLLTLQTLIIAGLLRQRAVRRKAEQSLRESEERFRRVANTAPVMIWMSGPDKHRTYYNEPWLNFTGGSLEAELAGGWEQSIHPEDRQRSLDADLLASERRQATTIEYRLRRHDGQYRWVLDSSVPRFDADGSFAGFIGSCIDVTEQKLAEEALSTVSQRLIQAHEEERTRIARELHDDLNQQLALLAMNLDRLKQDLPASATELRRDMEAARKQADELGSNIQALSHRLHSSKLQYLGLAAAASSFCREFSDRNGVEIEFNSDKIPTHLPEEISICLFRVLQEAVQNAAKYSGSRQVQVLLKGRTNQIELTVHDSGSGFEPEEALKGHGLGLTSMRERLKLVGGQLSIASKPQCGTSILARVPFVSEVKSVGAAG